MILKFVTSYYSQIRELIFMILIYLFYCRSWFRCLISTAMTTYVMLPTRKILASRSLSHVDKRWCLFSSLLPQGMLPP